MTDERFRSQSELNKNSIFDALVGQSPDIQKRKDEILRKQEIPLNKPYRNIVPIKMIVLSSGTKLVVSQGSVVNFDGDAIVNAANEHCLGGGGVDGAISLAGGSELLNARLQLPVLKVSGKTDLRCETGDAKITIGGQLLAKYCIHAVGPDYGTLLASGGSLSDCDDLLRSAYTSAMERAKENK